MSETVLNIPKITRWRPDFRYAKRKTEDIDIEVFESSEKSVTDKEAYRVTLASLRGTLASAQGMGDIDKSAYDLQPGEDYDPQKDLSYFYRPDVSVVEIDEAANRLKAQLVHFNGELKQRIQEELAKAEVKRSELVSKDVPQQDKGEQK